MTSPADEKETFLKKPFLEHIEDLRRTILWMLAALAVGMAVAVPLAPRVLELLKEPLRQAGQNPDQLLTVFDVSGAFSVAMRVILWTGLLLSAPFLLLFIGRFVFPGLTRRERRAVLGASGFAVALFAAGVVMGYRLTLPTALRLMLAVYAWMHIPLTWITLTSYVTFSLQILIAFGVVFEMPLVLLVLGSLGIITSAQLRSRRRHAIFVLLVIATVLTPPDVFSQLLMGVPLIVLYEACIWLVWLRERKAGRSGAVSALLLLAVIGTSGVTLAQNDTNDPVVLDMRFTTPFGPHEQPATPTNVPGTIAVRLIPTQPVAPDKLLDRSAFTNHGTAVNGARWASGGVSGGACAFDGRDAAVVVPDSPSLSFGAQTAEVPFSVSAWVNMRAAGGFPIACKADRGEWFFGTDDHGRLMFQVSSGLKGDIETWTSPEPLTADSNAWHWYAVSYDPTGATRRVVMYRDGRPLPCESDGRHRYYRIPDTDRPLEIGHAPGRCADGLLDEILIRRAVLPSEPALATYERATRSLAGQVSHILELPIVFPQPAVLLLRPPDISSWLRIGVFDFDIDWPPGACTNAQVLVYVQDWDYYWYQNLLPDTLRPGQRNRLSVDFSPDAEGWEPREHHSAWNFRAMLEPREVGIRIFSAQPYRGVCGIAGATALPRPTDTKPPLIRNVRASADAVPCFEKFELTVELPDRYVNPFDPNEVSVVAIFNRPDGSRVDTVAFYTRDYFRETSPSPERIVPQGRPVWRVRFSPAVPGKYSYSLQARDARGDAAWGPGTFTALPSRSPGFVRVASRDPRYFEFSDGSPFFPIGHNIRSPFDTRMDRQFPCMRRSPEGAAVYSRYFADMQRHGENASEIWSAPWFVGLEWDRSWPGFRGIGQYNLIHAWEMDRILEEAEARGIYLNIVVHNHGKFSTFTDPEWDSNPFSVRNGGYLNRPEEYFTDPRALRAFLNLMRYMVARWSYSRSVMAWELWSELDLTGSDRDNYRREAVVDWHRSMGQAVKDMDPNDHLIGTHVSGNYHHQNAQIIALPQMDFCPIDAYHHESSPLHIVSLLRETAEFNNMFSKPVLITEFGGSHMAAGLKHLSETLHAALWASVGIPLGGAPMFWWWGLIEEENLYPKFAALAAFMKGEDPRGPQRRMCQPELRVNGEPAPGVSLKCLKDRRDGYGWIYLTDGFSSADPQGPPALTNLVLMLNDMADGAIAVEFWDTVRGEPVNAYEGTVSNGVSAVRVPPLARDIAFKIKRPAEATATPKPTPR